MSKKRAAEAASAVSDVDLTELQSVCPHSNVDQQTNICRICSLKVTAAMRKQREEKLKQLTTPASTVTRRDVEPRLQPGQVIEMMPGERYRVEYVNDSRAYVVPLSSRTVVITDDAGEEKSFQKQGRGMSIAPNATVRIISADELSAEERDRVENMAKKTAAKKGAKAKAPKVERVPTRYKFVKNVPNYDAWPRRGRVVFDAIKKIGEGTAEQVGKALDKSFETNQDKAKLAQFFLNQAARTGAIKIVEGAHGRVLQSLEKGEAPAFGTDEKVQRRSERKQKAASNKAKRSEKAKSAKPAKKKAASKKAAPKTNGAAKKKAAPKKRASKKSDAAAVSADAIPGSDATEAAAAAE